MHCPTTVWGAFTLLIDQENTKASSNQNQSILFLLKDILDLSDPVRNQYKLNQMGEIYNTSLMGYILEWSRKVQGYLTVQSTLTDHYELNVQVFSNREEIY